MGLGGSGLFETNKQVSGPLIRWDFPSSNGMAAVRPKNKKKVNLELFRI